MPGLTLSPLPPPLPKVKRSLDPTFGRVVNLDLATASPEDLEEIRKALFQHSILVFPNTKITPERQLELTRMFDPSSQVYGHGNKGRQEASILHPDLKTLPDWPQVQVIGNGPVAEHEGLKDIRLKHPHHKTFHVNAIPDAEDEAFTRFYRWHIDAALYDLSPPPVTSLYAISVPEGRTQTVRYDDGTEDTLEVPLGTTAFVSGKSMFERLSPAEKSLAVRTTIKYAPHPYVWMRSSRSNTVGLGLESEGKELNLSELPEWHEDKIKCYPMLWKNPQTGDLHLQVHPSAIMELSIAAIPEGSPRSADSLYPDGAHITDLKEVRSVVYSMQRPAISPSSVYSHDWKKNDFALFHNQGTLHSVVGAFKDDEVRIFQQCNLAASSDPIGPDASDFSKYA